MISHDRYSIGEVEKICNIPIKTLRYYDSINLVVPSFRDSESNYRYYSKEQMVTICIVRKLRMLGFGLKEIHNIIHDNKAHILEESVDSKLVDISNEIKALQQKYEEGCRFSQRLKKGVDILSLYAKEEFEKKGIVIEEIPESYLLYTRKVMKNYSNRDVSLERWVELINLSNKTNIENKGSIVVTYYSNPLDQFLYKDIDIEFGMYLDEPVNLCECKKFGGFTAATTIHVGDYSNIINTHIKMIQYINKSGYSICGDISEEFIISPFDVNNPEEHVTKVIIPVKKI
ncbi:MerR family transcriptional regulator [Peptostreptococcus equinus]|uniref:MerR family transcriptional regulator n=1 Tax=Peptostreptococcus equinus TaxID=3003601 RepID=A0ABY7JP58_9FIRM|nr:MerR family transcriptional regulator [Peptostreptococcus sp. CBA3647]WAW15132.1 MerR family transcriptional regulator [Peptostreptococcus sp. CBA3647]